jgi:hypothetical protein
MDEKPPHVDYATPAPRDRSEVVRLYISVVGVILCLLAVAALIAAAMIQWSRK